MYIYYGIVKLLSVTVSTPEQCDCNVISANSFLGTFAVKETNDYNMSQNNTQRVYNILQYSYI